MRIDNSFIFITFSHPRNIKKYLNLKSPAFFKITQKERYGNLVAQKV